MRTADPQAIMACGHLVGAWSWLGFACGDGAAGTADEAEVRSALCFADTEVNGDVDSCTSRMLERPCSFSLSKQLSTQTRG